MGSSSAVGVTTSSLSLKKGSTPPASAPVGRRSKIGAGRKHDGRHTPELVNAPYQKTRNSIGEISGRNYTGHALDRMQNRGLTPTVVENAINTGAKSPARGGTTNHFDAKNNVTVLTNSSGKVITVY